jgi:hypothetical protein
MKLISSPLIDFAWSAPDPLYVARIIATWPGLYSQESPAMEACGQSPGQAVLGRRFLGIIVPVIAGFRI